MSAVYLRRLVEDAHSVELRVQVGGRWQSQHFTDVGALHGAINRADADGLTCYTTLNRPAEALGRAEPTRDCHIGTIVRLPFDLDPARPTGVASTDSELENALEARRHLVALLAACGWPTPALGMSGNGAHAVYRCCVRHTPEWCSAADVIYSGLKARLAEVCDSLSVQFDTTVRNPGRIWRVYGTTNRKGEPTPERPHRKAEVILPAGAWQTVKTAVLQRTVDAWRADFERDQQQARAQRVRQLRTVDGKGDYDTLDVVGWFQGHGCYRRQISTGKHAVVCPWSGTHSTKPRANDSSTVIFENPAGWPGFHCSHDHCSGLSIVDVMALWGDADAWCTKEWERRHG